MRGTNSTRQAGLHALILAAAALGAWLIGSCRDASRAAGTSIFVNVSFESPDLRLTHIRFSARSDTRSLFDPVVRPGNDTSGYLESGQTLRILLPDSLTGQTITVGAEGLSQGRVVTQDHSDVRVKKDYEVEVDLSLPTTGGEPMCGSCVGCCSGVSCITNYSMANCGNDPLCTRCNPTVADNCSNGDCRCGSGAACSSDAGSDKCVLGQCRCGSSDACRPGQFCVNGQCTCTLTSCPRGCCTNNLCLPSADAGVNTCGTASKSCDRCTASQTCTGGVCSDCPANCSDGCCSGETCYFPGLFNCGKGGRACVACDPIASDGCNAQGLCACGNDLACAPGQHCQGGTCLCDAISCPNGCCKNNLCENAPAAGTGALAALSVCGKGGRACVACDPNRSDTCTSSGVCACGNGPACDPGLKCFNGTCVCDPATCAGCCSPDGQGCRPGSVDSECGKQGFTCQACPSNQSCTGGGPDGGVCSGCTSASCSFGCCSGSSCIVNSPGPCPGGGGLCPCGINGASCVSCATLRTDTCKADGTCGCGSSPPCNPGQHCINGQCFCDSTSCPTGCCTADANCVQPSVSQCGAGGSCFACRPDLANNCSSNGNCRCGSGPACIDGQQRCLSSGCVCDSISCPRGCCNASGLCLSPALNTCGAMGSSCVSCDQVRANRCLNGACACGDGGVCPSGQQCVSGTCQCTPTSCATGCCSVGGTCTTASTSACGLNGVPCAVCPSGGLCRSGSCQCCFADGGSCNACGVNGDSCLSNMCRCGTGAGCAGSLRCVSGHCT